MGRYKRKASSDQEEEDELENDSSDYRESKPKPKVRSTREKTVKAESKSGDELGSGSQPPAKKVKKVPSPVKQEDVSGSGSIVHSTADGDRYIDLGKKKRATVRSFKGTALLDIREFYGADGDEKPGKKGIALTLEQWETLKSSSTTIDGLFQSLKK